SGSDLSQADLEEAVLNGAILRGTNLTQVLENNAPSKITCST
ncbi:MAG: pentapeptide repeat-containing protein, partial [Cyanobacteria bacterium P01_G01_bin.49]